MEDIIKFIILPNRGPRQDPLYSSAKGSFVTMSKEVPEKEGLGLAHERQITRIVDGPFFEESFLPAPWTD